MHIYLGTADVAMVQKTVPKRKTIKLWHFHC